MKARRHDARFRSVTAHDLEEMLDQRGILGLQVDVQAHGWQLDEQLRERCDPVPAPEERPLTVRVDEGVPGVPAPNLGERRRAYEPVDPGDAPPVRIVDGDDLVVRGEVHVRLENVHAELECTPKGRQRVFRLLEGCASVCVDERHETLVYWWESGKSLPSPDFRMTRWLLGLLFVTACGSAEDEPSGAGKGGTGTAANAGNSAGTDNGGSGNASTSGGSSSGSAGRGGSGAAGGSGAKRYFGDSHSGNFWLGPVDYAETEWHNACAPSVKYPVGIQSLYGNYIMGLANEVLLDSLLAGNGQLCDTCVELAANGTTLLARAVTYGEETGPNDIDVSPEVDAALDGDASRSVTWRFVTCPTDAPIQYTFDGRQWDNVWFFRVWVRNSRVPITKVEVRLGSGSYTEADWQSDGAFQASSQDFSGGFTLRVTSIDGATLEDDLPGLNTFDPDVGVSSHGNFD